VAKKFGDDEGGGMTGLIAYRAFLSLFPLLLLMTTVLGYLLADHPDLERSILDSTLTQFPVIGEEIRGRGLEGNGLALAVGIVGSLWAGLAVVLALGDAFDRVWGVPKKARAGFASSRLRALGLLLAIGTLSIASTVASGLAGGGGSSALGAVAGVAISIALNLLVFGVAFRLLTASSVATRSLLPGVVAAALGWEALQLLGGLYLTHAVRDATPVYGTFALVIGLLAWIHLGALLTVMSAELNAVWAKRLWPRNLLG
jgi:YihY family inner membrane protein